MMAIHWRPTLFHKRVRRGKLFCSVTAYCASTIRSKPVVGHLDSRGDTIKERMISVRTARKEPSIPGFIKLKHVVAVTQDFWAVSGRASASFTSMSQINTGVSRERTGRLFCAKTETRKLTSQRTRAHPKRRPLRDERVRKFIRRVERCWFGSYDRGASRPAVVVC